MSSARIDKLKALLKRVEERKAQPRLRAVPSPASQAAAPAKLQPEVDEELSFDTTPPEPATLPPAAEAVRAPSAPREPVRTPAPGKPAPVSPIADAFTQLPERTEDSGPLEVRALAEPITTPEREEPDTEPPSAPSAEPDVLLTHRPQAAPSLPPIELVPAVPTFAPPPSGVREPTLEFATRPAAAPRAIEVGTAEPTLPLSAPIATIEAKLSTAVQPPVHAVSAVRIEAPKTFGELLELSLSLRVK